MITHLQEVAHAIVRRAQRQGFVIPSEIRAELTAARLPEDLWKEAAALAGSSLSHRRGRYYYASPAGNRLEEAERQQRTIQKAVRQLIRQHKAAATGAERRQEGRIDFIQPVKVQTGDGRELTLLSRDISTTGLRLVGTRSLLGQKVRVRIPGGEGVEPKCFLVRILWTCAIGDELFENGGTFLEMLAPEPEPLKVVS